MTTFTPRPYQEKAINLGIDHMLHGKGNAFEVLPTGSGKSIVIAGVADKLDGPVLVFQPSKEILEQNYHKMRSFGHLPAIFSASAGKKQIAHITFATIGSVINRKEDFEHFKHVIVDECHLFNPATSGMYTTFMRHLAEVNGTAPRILGVTATPYRLGSNRMGSQIRMLHRMNPRVWNKMLYCVQISELRKQGFLAEMEYFRTAGMDVEMLKFNTNGSEYTEASVKAAWQASEMTAKVVNVTERVLQKRKNALVFVPSVLEAEEVASFIPGAEWVCGETPRGERERIINGFKNGQIRAVCNVGVLCLDDKTEILTEQGWTGIDDMSYDHNVACWSLDGSITFAPPKFIVRRPRKPGERMVVAQGSAIDFRVTEDHRMVRSMGRDRRWGEQLARDTVGRRFNFPASGYSSPLNIQPDQEEVNHNSRRLKINNAAYNYRKSGMTVDGARMEATAVVDSRIEMQYTTPSALTLDDCRFIGFWLADGTLAQGRCSISQSERYNNIIVWFEKVLERMGLTYTKSKYPAIGNMTFDAIKWNFSRGTGGRGQRVDGGYYRMEPYLNKLGTLLFWGLNDQQFGALLEGFWYGDGEHGTTAYESSSLSWRVRGTQKSLYDILQAVGACRGYRMTLRPVKERNPNHSPQWSLRWQKRTSTSIGWARPQFEDGWKEERVWCVTSETSFIITRRNGIVTITGNTTGFDYPALDTIVLARPTRSLSLYYQMTGRAMRPHPDKKSGWVIDMVGLVNTFGYTEDLTVGKEMKRGVLTDLDCIYGSIPRKDKDPYVKQLTNVNIQPRVESQTGYARSFR